MRATRDGTADIKTLRSERWGFAADDADLERFLDFVMEREPTLMDFSGLDSGDMSKLEPPSDRV